MGIVRKLRDGARWIENVVEVEAPRPTPAEQVDDNEQKPAPANNSSAPEATR
ncbi:hypothetical protein [Amycolatopsis benzoatilytica]|uniref:hypothetical protein n=1 Tax=Amycolatopsis benzoatilytica TaxID=346045 RepID=UPI00036D5D0A|nr:hypothetical protein [Amycolatopsis benzoatilytica]